MSSLSSIDTSTYTTPLAAGMESLQPQGARAYEEQQVPNAAAVNEETPEVDLSSYYSNVQPSELNADLRSNVSLASQKLSGAISAAVQNGSMSTQDAVNIQKAVIAYETTLNSAKSSTFELDVA